MFIPPDHIIPELRSKDRFSAIRELLRHLIHVGAIPSDAEDALFSAFCEREEVMTTGVGLGIAIPHISTELVTERVLVLGRSESGIDFPSMDGNLIKEVILMISPAS